MPPMMRVQKNPLRPEGGVLGALADLFLGENPEEEMQNALMPGPLVTIFKDKLAREASTKIFKESSGLLGNSWYNAANKFANRYPRIAAHIRLYPALNKEKAGAFLEPSEGKVDKLLPIGVTKLGRAIANTEPLHAVESIFHEGTHAAQNLGNSQFNTLYNLFHDLVGYAKNPFEQSAESAGMRAVGNRYTPQISAKELIEQIMQKTPNSEQKSIYDAIQKILNERMK